MLTFETNDPRGLLAAFTNGIKAGHIKTWEVDSDGDFTHKTASLEWYKKAWLRPIVETGRLKFKLFGQQKNVTWEVYGVYHGRFIESMIVHCNNLFTTGTATAKPVSGVDNIAA